MSQANLNASAGSPVVPRQTPAAGSVAAVRSAIARAAQATGVDFSYLLAQARLESSLDPQVHAATSSAAGLYQFTKGTWGTMLARHGEALGLGGFSATAPAASPARLMALRYDPDAAAMMAAKLAGDNSDALTAVLGRAPSSSELYLAHFLGAAGAARFLGGLAADPGQSAAALLPRAAAANRTTFFAGGVPRSVGEVMALIQTRMDSALQDDGNGNGSGNGNADPVMAAMGGGPADLGATQIASWPLDQQTAPPQAIAPSTGQATPAPPPSMADTLRDTFGLAGAGAAAGQAPDFVRSAYGRMQALGL